MIINFKKFENWQREYGDYGYYDDDNDIEYIDDRDSYWVIPLKKPDFTICLNKIGMNEEQIDRWEHLYKNNVFTDHGKYSNRKTITLKNHKSGNFTWQWVEIKKSNSFIDFKGKLECTPEEIQEYYDNIEMKKNVDKYNL